MALHPTRPVVLRLYHDLLDHPGEGRHGDGGGGGGHGGGDGGFHGGFGGGRRSDGGRGSDGDRPRGPRGPGPDRPPDPGPADTEDAAEGPFRVVRPADMLVVDISLVNLRRDGSRLVPRVPGAPAFVLAVLPPQHVMEQAFPAETPAPSAPVKAFTAGPTTLSFSVPADLNGLDLSLEALLDWKRLVPLTDLSGLPGGAAGPTGFQDVPGSVLEFPTRLLITYDGPVDWLSRPQPHRADGRTALWHALLHSTRDGDVQLRAFAAVRDRGPHLGSGSLSDVNREDIVTLTSRAELVPPGGPPIEVPSESLHSEQFIVTPLGASAHLHGAWEAPPEGDKDRYPAAGRPYPDLEMYDHITGLGRDQYVRVVTRGRLCTRHRASHVEEYRRVFVADPQGGIVAYLRREDRIIVKEPEVEYGADGYTHGGREMPFTSLRITDRVTPLIMPPDSPPTERPGDPSAPIRDRVLLGAARERQELLRVHPDRHGPRGQEGQLQDAADLCARRTTRRSGCTAAGRSARAHRYRNAGTEAARRKARSHDGQADRPGDGHDSAAGGCARQHQPPGRRPDLRALHGRHALREDGERTRPRRRAVHRQRRLPGSQVQRHLPRADHGEAPGGRLPRSRAAGHGRTRRGERGWGREPEDRARADHRTRGCRPEPLQEGPDRFSRRGVRPDRYEEGVRRSEAARGDSPGPVPAGHPAGPPRHAPATG